MYQISMMKIPVMQNHSLRQTASYCNVLQHTATCASQQHPRHKLEQNFQNFAMHIASHGITLHHTTPHCNSPLHTATQWNTLQCTTIYLNPSHRLRTESLAVFACVIFVSCWKKLVSSLFRKGSHMYLLYTPKCVY